MHQPRELYLVQGFLQTDQFEEVPGPAYLFSHGKQVAQDPLRLPHIQLSNSAHVRKQRLSTSCLRLGQSQLFPRAADLWPSSRLRLIHIHQPTAAQAR